MRRNMVRSGLIVLTALLAAAGCFRLERVEYLSIEKAQGIQVVARSSLAIERSTASATIVTEYQVSRARYQLSITVNPRSVFANATIHLVEGSGLKLRSRPEVAVREGRPRPCGSYESPSGDSNVLLFKWVICDHNVLPSEYLLAFDVVDESGSVVGEERIPFELRTSGVAVLDDSI